MTEGYGLDSTTFFGDLVYILYTFCDLLFTFHLLFYKDQQQVSMGYQVVVRQLQFIIYFASEYVDGNTPCVSFTELAKVLQELEL